MCFCVIYIPDVPTKAKQFQSILTDPSASCVVCQCQSMLTDPSASCVICQW